MIIQNINIGQYPNDGRGDDLRTAFEKIIGNFNSIDANVVLSSENLGTGIPIALEDAQNNKLRFRTLTSSNNKLSIGFDSFNVSLTVNDFILNDLIDVDAPNPSIKQVLGWNGNVWSSESLDTSYLRDISSIAPSTNQVLSWNGLEWEPTTLNTSFLSNISSATPTSNQVLGWNGSGWQPTTLNFNFLNDVSIVNPQINDSLVWNGSRWVPTNIDVGVIKITAGENITISPDEGTGNVTINADKGVPDGFDFGIIGSPTNMLELLAQATPVDFGTINLPTSLILDLGFIDTTPPIIIPTYQLTSNVLSASEGSVIEITLTTTNVSNGTIVPYIISGVTSSDINGSNLIGSFIVNNNTATVSIPLTIDTEVETEIFRLSLIAVTPTVSIAINLTDFILPDVISGGSPDTTVFALEFDGGTPAETGDDYIIDGGLEELIELIAVIDGGDPFTLSTVILDGESPSTPVTVLVDC